jgi:hypothetical protein
MFWSSGPLQDDVCMQTACEKVGVLSACLAKPHMKREALGMNGHQYYELFATIN